MLMKTFSSRVLYKYPIAYQNGVTRRVLEPMQELRGTLMWSVSREQQPHMLEIYLKTAEGLLGLQHTLLAKSAQV